MLIHNYGLFWEAKQVLWQGAGRGGRAALWGWGSRGKKRGVVNFRRQTGLYVLYADYKPIYAGQAANGKSNLFVRLRHHWNVDLRGRWDRFSWFGTREVTSGGTLARPSKGTTTLRVMHDQLEALLLSAMELPQNKQGGKWSKAKRYTQERDPRLGLTEVQMLRDLLDNADVEWREELDRKWAELLE
jgi:hypothetical protein